jgi:hypothetical protein
VAERPAKKREVSPKKRQHSVFLGERLGKKARPWVFVAERPAKKREVSPKKRKNSMFLGER